jgi:hypothetical protein
MSYEALRLRGQGIVRENAAQEQPADKQRAQTVHKVDPKKSVLSDAARDPELNDAEKVDFYQMKSDQPGAPNIRDATSPRRARRPQGSLGLVHGRVHHAAPRC